MSRPCGQAERAVQSSTTVLPKAVLPLNEIQPFVPFIVLLMWKCHRVLIKPELPWRPCASFQQQASVRVSSPGSLLWVSKDASPKLLPAFVKSIRRVIHVGTMDPAVLKWGCRLLFVVFLKLIFDEWKRDEVLAIPVSVGNTDQKTKSQTFTPQHG